MELLQKHFDTALESPDGIKKLRELILTLAMQGKLVKQDPTDQPARELLKEIQAEKERLIKEGKIKNQKELPPIKPEEVPYQVPSGWEWVNLREVTHEWGQKTPDKDFVYIDVGSIDNSKGSIIDYPQVLAPEDAPSRARKIVKQGTIIYSTVRPYLLNIAIVEKTYNVEPIASTAFAIMHPLNGFNGKYLYRYLNSNTFINFVESKQKGVAYPAISDGDLFQGTIPLPPLTEQKRIVAKIDELMALCDKLEAQRNARNDKRLAVHTAAINCLLTATDKSDFDSAWQFITRHFDPIYSVKENVAELKKAILTLAMQGKLVKQDPKNQPASQLLKEIQAEKERLIKEGKIKKQKELPPIKQEEVLYEVPEGWEWVRLGEIVSKLGSGSTPSGGKETYVDQGIMFFRSQNIYNDGLKAGNISFISSEIHEKMSGTKILPFDILFNITGGSLGRSALVPENFSEGNISQHVCIIRPLHISNDYLHKLTISSVFQNQIPGGITGGGREGLQKNRMELFIIPLPPLAEQKSIVAKINELMALCEQLETRIDQATAKQIALFDAVLMKV